MADIFERISNGEFFLDEPYPEPPAEIADIDDVLDVLERHDIDVKYREAVAAYRDKQRVLLRRFRDALETEYGLSGHPKAGKVYALAWEYMHRQGLVEIASMYGDLADLVLGNDLN